MVVVAFGWHFRVFVMGRVMCLPGEVETQSLSACMSGSGPEQTHSLFRV